MRHKTFFWFILPSALAMIIFIALPIVSVAVQSLYIGHARVMIEVENCGPFGCQMETQVDVAATKQLVEDQPLGIFNGFGTYANRGHLAIGEIAEIWRTTSGPIDFVNRVYDLPFYKALTFTLTYTFVVAPLVLVLGFIIALAVNSLPGMLKGPTIFFSLLPMIVTPLIGSLILFWMIDARGIIGNSLQVLFDDPNLSLKASKLLTWITLFVYGVWHNSPFAFIVFYAGLQTVPRETLESAKVDGANRWQQVRYVILPHLMPLAIFIILMQLMDGFRVFEPIVGFSASAKATSLSWIIYNDLTSEIQLFASASATSVLTIIGTAVLLTPVLIRTWRNFEIAGK